jgi:hypothetical protein
VSQPALRPLSASLGGGGGGGSLLGGRTGSLRGMSVRAAREGVREVNQSITGFVNWFSGSPNG